jgi:hypothetical protein
VWEDRSLGVHNPKYAAAILQASIDDLRGGIDVDRDGLLDSWEMANFGNLTSQSGNGDADGDGALNALEMGAGTNPKTRDTDGDGIEDYIELLGGTDPLNAASKPGTNAVVILPAVELGYLPGRLGVKQQFQVLDDLGSPSGWTDIGPSVVSSNAWFYYLKSMRDTSEKFFRVITKP